MISRFTSWRTTACGFAFSALVYWQGIGFKLPETRQDFATLLGSTLFAVWGAVQRDAKVSEEEHKQDMEAMKFKP